MLLYFSWKYLSKNDISCYNTFGFFLDFFFDQIFFEDSSTTAVAVFLISKFRLIYSDVPNSFSVGDDDVGAEDDFARQSSLIYGSSQILNFKEPEPWFVISELHTLVYQSIKSVKDDEYSAKKLNLPFRNLKFLSCV